MEPKSRVPLEPKSQVPLEPKSGVPLEPNPQVTYDTPGLVVFTVQYIRVVRGSLTTTLFDGVPNGYQITGSDCSKLRNNYCDVGIWYLLSK